MNIRFNNNNIINININNLILILGLIIFFSHGINYNLVHGIWAIGFIYN